MNKVNVLEIGPGNFAGKAGLSLIAWNWYKRMDHNKLQIDFMSCFLPSEEYINCILYHGGRFYHINGRNKVQRLLNKALESRKLVKANCYHCIHIHASYSLEAFIYYLSVKNYCSNILIHSHSTEIDRTTLNPTFFFYIKSLLNKFSKLFLGSKQISRLACSELAAKWMFPHKVILNRDFSIIKNGINISQFAFSQKIRDKVRTELNFKNKFIIGHIGRFTFQKNHSFLLNVFYEVYKKNQNTILLLVGNGELETKVKTYTQNLGLEDAVYFYGSSSNAYELYQAMDCFVLPSHFEGLGIVAIEAQAAGLRTLCADTVPKEAQITDLLEYMSLSAPAKKWAEKILSYNNFYERKDMSAELRQAGYDINDSSAELEDLYLECTEKKADSNT